MRTYTFRYEALSACGHKEFITEDVRAISMETAIRKFVKNLSRDIFTGSYILLSTVVRKRNYNLAQFEVGTPLNITDSSNWTIIFPESQL